MSVRVGSARIDEKGKLTGGMAGDQTGMEVAIEPWYLHSKGWIVLRPKDSNIAERIAANMEAACANDNIGYDQSTSWDLYDKAKWYGWDCAAVTVPTEIDCSSLIRVCVAYAVQKNIGWFSTLNEVEVLFKTGLFDVLTDTKYTRSSDYLKRGDILCTCTQGHTVAVLDNGAKVTQSSTQPSSDNSQGNTSLCGTGIGTAVALQPMHIRSGAGTNHTSLTIIPTGTTVEVLSMTSGWYKIVWPRATCGYAYTAQGGSYYSYTAKAEPDPIKVGDQVRFIGTAQYISAWAIKPVIAKSCTAKVSQICEDGKHQYHLVGTEVYGWVDKEWIKK